MNDVFISYARKDSLDFARVLHETLQQTKHEVWFDQEDIPAAVDFQDRIDKGILEALNFVFIISPASVQSAYCRKEIEYAIRLKKRIIPILLIEPDKEIVKKYMHPKIGKLNWIFFRQGVDDFFEAFDKLKHTLAKDKQYLEQHTEIQMLALRWKDLNKSEDVLLFGEPRIIAQNWLTSNFENNDAPAEITNLHCEFITQSRRRAERYTTDIYLISAPEDNYWTKKIKFALLRKGHTVSERQDTIVGFLGSNPTESLIVKSRYVVLLVSENSINELSIQDELAIAKEYQKPVIVLKLDKQIQTPQVQTSFSPIDFSQVQPGDSFREAFEAFVKHFENDVDYFVKHQRILGRAYDWMLQHHNPSLLLRDEVLELASLWLVVAQKRSINGAIKLQIDFIQQSVNSFRTGYHAFIAYAASDYDFARYVNEELLLHAKSTWFSQQYLSRENFKETVLHSIEASNYFLYIHSNRAVSDLEQKAQLGHALRMRKPIIVLTYNKCTASQDESIAHIEAIDFGVSRNQFRSSFSELIRQIDNSREFVQTQTRLLTQALEWQKQNESTEKLLTTHECDEAEQWLEQAVINQIELSELHKRYIQRSLDFRALKARQRKRLLLTQRVVAVLFGFTFMATLFFAYSAVQSSKTQQVLREKAQRLFIQAKASNLVALARQLERSNPTIALRLAQKAYEIDSSENVDKTLHDIYKRHLFYRLIGKQEHTIRSLAYVAQNNLLCAAGELQQVEVYKADGSLRTVLKGHLKAVNCVSAEPNGTNLVTASDDNTIRLWSASGEMLNVIAGHEQAVTFACFSPDGKMILSGGSDGALILWSLKGDMLKILTGHTGAIRKAIFLSDGNSVVSSSNDGSVILWNLRSETYSQLPGTSPITTDLLALSNNQLITCGTDGFIRQYRGVQLVSQFKAQQSALNAIAVNEGLGLIATGGSEHVVSLFDFEGHLLSNLSGHEQSITSLIFSADAQVLYSAAHDNRLLAWPLKAAYPKIVARQLPFVQELRPKPEGGLEWLAAQTQGWIPDSGAAQLKSWKNPIEKFPAQSIIGLNSFAALPEVLATLTDKSINTLCVTDSAIAYGSTNGTVTLIENGQQAQIFANAHIGAVSSVLYIPEHKMLISGGTDNNVHLYYLNKKDTLLTGHKDVINTLAYNPVKEYIASASADGTIRLFNLDGSPRKMLQGHEASVEHLTFSPNGRFLASVDSELNLHIWEPDFYEIKELELPGKVSALSFSADSKNVYWATEYGNIWRLPLPLPLNEFLAADKHAPLSIAQMLDMKIKFYEELKSENELYQGGLYYFAKAALQDDRARQLHSLGYADSLLTRLVRLHDKALYRANEIQVQLALRKFTNQPQFIDESISELSEGILKVTTQTELEETAAFLYESALKETSGYSRELNLDLADKLFKKLYLQYSKASYLVQQTSITLLRTPGKSTTEGVNLNEILTRFREIKSDKELLEAARLFYLKSQNQRDHANPGRYLVLSAGIYEMLLQRQAIGDYFVALTEVRLHQLKNDSTQTEVRTKLKNIELQLYSLKNNQLVQDAADRFLFKAEREADSKIQVVYFTQAASLYAKLAADGLKAINLINLRKVLLGLRRLQPHSEQVATRLKQNLDAFAQLRKTSELLIAINFFERELQITATQSERIKLLEQSLALYQRITQLDTKSDYLGGMFKVVLQLWAVQPGNSNLLQTMRNIRKQFDQASDTDFLLNNIALHDKWLQEIKETRLRSELLENQLILYSRLISLDPQSRYVIRLWKTLAFDNNQIGRIMNQNEFWSQISKLPEGAEREQWTLFLQQEAFAGIQPLDRRIEIRRQAIENLKKQGKYPDAVYNIALDAARESMSLNRYTVAIDFARVALDVTGQRPQAHAIAGMATLAMGQQDKALQLFRNQKKLQYRNRSFASYFEDELIRAEQRGYSPTWAKLIRDAIQ